MVNRMDDYIDKQKTLNVIFEIAENVINSLPSADVVEVVRCCNCKHYEVNDDKEWCFIWGSRTAVNGYCSYGERK